MTDTDRYKIKPDPSTVPYTTRQKYYAEMVRLMTLDGLLMEVTPPQGCDPLPLQLSIEVLGNAPAKRKWEEVIKVQGFSLSSYLQRHDATRFKFVRAAIGDKALLPEVLPLSSRVVQVCSSNAKDRAVADWVARHLPEGGTVRDVAVAFGVTPEKILRRLRSGKNVGFLNVTEYTRSQPEPVYTATESTKARIVTAIQLWGQSWRIDVVAAVEHLDGGN